MGMAIASPKLSFIEKLKLMIFRLTGREVLDFDMLIKLVQNKAYLSSIYNYPYKRRLHLRSMYEALVISDFEARIKTSDRERARMEKECEDICRSGSVHSCKVCQQKLASIIKELEYYTIMRGLVDVLTEPLRFPIIRTEYLQVAYEASETINELMQRGLEAMGTDVENKAREIISKYEAQRRELKIKSELERAGEGLAEETWKVGEEGVGERGG